MRSCESCGKRLTTYEKRFCSRSCTAKGLGRCGQGANGLRWKGGRRVEPNRYVRLWDPVHRYRYEHRVVAEQMLGRPLTSAEHVHHRNGDKTDNRPENLVVMSARDHNLAHPEKLFVPTARWAAHFDACIDCGTTERRHEGGGRCCNCQQKWKRAQRAA